MPHDDDLGIELDAVDDDTDDDADDPAADVLTEIRGLADELVGLVDGLGPDSREEYLHKLATYTGVLRKLRDELAEESGTFKPVAMSRATVQAVLNGQFGRKPR